MSGTHLENYTLFSCVLLGIAITCSQCHEHPFRLCTRGNVLKQREPIPFENDLDILRHEQRAKNSSQLECNDHRYLILVDIRRHLTGFQATIQACKSVLKILLRLGDSNHFRRSVANTWAASCDRFRDTMLILHPTRHQTVGIVPSKNTEAIYPRLTWAYEYLTKNASKWQSRHQQTADSTMEKYPKGCGETKSCIRFGKKECGHMECDYLLVYSLTNRTFLELEISGNVNGWIALGLSSDDRMAGDDVIVCKRKSVLGPELQALSMWIDLPHTRPQPKEDNQLKLVSQQVKDGYIYCKITRVLDSKDTGGDKSLDLTNNWFQLYGKGEIDRHGVMLQHNKKPPSSLDTISMLRNVYIHSKEYAQLKAGATSNQYFSTSVLILVFVIHYVLLSFCNSK